ncbi:hypothetical protein Vadar_020083 [Vaccinium darrowii]|uniref:Uncharacterized protein n=1 Tax=Vaccinium darrowii TaxID=229202 RepID=A0ACB7YWY1_9ERIC|nr:hypothetical protein Vadar_020083 [Vaccinium darrowii]
MSQLATPFLKRVECELGETIPDYTKLENDMLSFKAFCLSLGVRQIPDKCRDFGRHCRLQREQRDGCKTVLEEIMKYFTKIYSELSPWIKICSTWSCHHSEGQMEVAINNLVGKGFLEPTVIGLVTESTETTWDVESTLFGYLRDTKNQISSITDRLVSVDITQRDNVDIPAMTAITNDVRKIWIGLKRNGLGKVENSCHMLLLSCEGIEESIYQRLTDFTEEFQVAEEKLSFYFKIQKLAKMRKKLFGEGLLGLKFIELENVSRERASSEVTSALRDITTLVRAMEEKLKKAMPDFLELNLDAQKLVIASSRMGASKMMKSCNDFIRYFLQDNFDGCREAFPRLKEEGKAVGLYLYNYFMELGMPLEVTIAAKLTLL